MRARLRESTLVLTIGSVLLLSCGRAEGPAPGAPAPAAPSDSVLGGPGETARTPLGALAEAQRLEVRLALSAFNKALLNYHVLNDRYPRDLAEIEADPFVAGALRDLRAAVRDVTYEAGGGGYQVGAVLPNGRPISMSGSDPTLRPGAP